VLPKRDVTLLARRRMLPSGELRCICASVTDDDRRRRTPYSITSLPPTLCVGWPVTNSLALLSQRRGRQVRDGGATILPTPTLISTRQILVMGSNKLINYKVTYVKSLPSHVGP